MGVGVGVVAQELIRRSEVDKQLSSGRQSRITSGPRQSPRAGLLVQWTVLANSSRLNQQQIMNNKQ
eukprot:1495266-Pyramimonas_sp.AAC.1